MTRLAECTPGPYEVCADAVTTPDGGVCVCRMPSVNQTAGRLAWDANADLLALAFDHALLLAAVTSDVVFMQSINGAVCIEVYGDEGEGDRIHIAEELPLTPFGTPQLTPELRAALCRAVGTNQETRP